MLNDYHKRILRYGLIVFIFERFFRLLQFLPFQCFIGNNIDSKNWVGLSEKSRPIQENLTIKRARRIDIYILSWIAVEIFLMICVMKQLNFPILNLMFLILPILRIIDIVQVNINILIFNPIRNEDRNYIASPTRSLINVIINFIELIVCFGIIYNQHLNHLVHSNEWHLVHSNEWTDGFYFSAITQLTVGYGDLVPICELKTYSSIQAIIGYLFTVLTISRFINILPRTGRVIGKDDSNVNDI